MIISLTASAKLEIAARVALREAMRREQMCRQGKPFTDLESRAVIRGLAHAGA